MPGNLWETDSAYPVEPGDDAAFTAFETEFGVRLPEFFKSVYRIQNGGALRDVDWPDCLFPISTADEPYGRVCSLQMWAESGAMLTADDLDWVEEQYGDPNLVFPLTSDGHVSYALDYNQAGPDGEPSVIYLDFECISDARVAPSFEAWIRQLTASETDCAVDWEEHQKYPLLFRDSFTNKVTAHGKPEQIENVLCQEGENSLLLFTRTQAEGKTLELSQVSLPKGVDSRWLDVAKFRPAPSKTFTLHLQAVNIADIHWVTSKATRDGTWKNERSSGVPIYCTVESQDRKSLKALAKQLHEAGFVHNAPPPDTSEMPAEFQEHMQQMEEMAKALMAQHQEMADQPAPTVPSEAPAPGGDPATLGDEAIVDELSQIILYYSGQVDKVHSPDDARQLIDRMVPLTDRYIVLLRQLGVAANPMKGLPLRPAEQVNLESMNRLLSRSHEAYNLLEQNGRRILMEAMRPADQDASVDEFVERFVAAAGAVAELLGRVMQGKDIAPHRDALQEALHEYTECDRRFVEMVTEMDTLQVGWMTQKRNQSSAFTSLVQNWSDFRTRHRKLYKANREMFDALEDWL